VEDGTPHNDGDNDGEEGHHAEEDEMALSVTHLGNLCFAVFCEVKCCLAGLWKSESELHCAELNQTSQTDRCFILTQSGKHWQISSPSLPIADQETIIIRYSYPLVSEKSVCSYHLKTFFEQHVIGLTKETTTIFYPDL
jgi:hypothetical protein